MFLNAQMRLNWISCCVELDNCCIIRLDCRYHIELGENLTTMGKISQGVVLPKLMSKLQDHVWSLSLSRRHAQKSTAFDFLKTVLPMY